VVGQFLGGCLASGSGDDVGFGDFWAGTCEMVGGVVVDAFLRCRPGARLAILVSTSVGFVVTVLGFVGEAGW
jgi:hypothetical protein